MHIDQIATTITPEMASDLLKKNYANRKISKPNYTHYMTDMINGNWQLNGETIKVAIDGELIDGQNRLTACVISGKSFRTVLITGLPNVVKKTIDSGKKRSFKDRATMDAIGTKHGAAVGSAINFMASLANKTSRKGQSILTHSEMFEVLEMHPKLWDSAELCYKAFNGMTSSLTAMHYIASSLGYQDDADSMVQVWRDGQRTYENDAMVFCREFMISDSQKQKKADYNFKYALLINCYNKFLTKSPMTQARLRADLNFIDGWNEYTMYKKEK